jgi:Tfp pilus assembly protein PilV
MSPTSLDSLNLLLGTGTLTLMIVLVARNRIVGGRPPLGSERGSMLIEVMVGAVVLAISTAAILDGMDGAQDTGRRNKDRSVSSTLAQQDVERLRSMPITALSNLSQTRTVDVNGVNYTVDSTTEWVRDSSGVVSCTDDSTQAEYLKVSSTATAPASANHPVTETTLLTPAPGAFSTTAGTAAVRATDRQGKALAGVTVKLNGPSSQTGTTNDLGCAIFGYIPAGDYTATIPGGLVSWNSEIPASTVAKVNAGKTTLVPIELDDPASLRAHFVKPDGSATAWNSISVAHANLPGGFKVFPLTASATKFASISADTLFPQLGGYGVYAGSCEANNPAYWNPDYFETSGKGHVELDPGDLLKDVDVVLPTLRIDFTKQRNRDAHIYVTQADNPVPEIDCRNAVGENVTIIKSSSTSTTLETVNANFVLPFGHYRVCVDDGNRRRVSTATGTASATTPLDQDLTTAANVTLTPTITASTSTTASALCSSTTSPWKP